MQPALVVGLCLSAGAGPPRASIEVSYRQAQPLVVALGERSPAALRGVEGAKAESAWRAWLERRAAGVRERLDAGDEDALVNLLLFGTSFTRRPRVTGDVVDASAPGGGEAFEGAFLGRVADLTAALRGRGGGERLDQLRALVRRKGLSVEDPGGAARLRAYLLQRVAQARRDLAGYERELSAARERGGAAGERAERSRLFRDRGIALDTSLRPAFAVEEALAALKASGGLAPAGVRRALVVGPGLDFVDKQEGYDFYPPQSIQAAALVDSLLRLGLSRPGALEVVAVDVSPRVVDHLAAARHRAVAGEPYVVQLPRDPRQAWRPAFVEFWRRAGEEIGAPVEAVRPPAAAGPVEVRAVGVRPEVVARIDGVRLDVVERYLDLADGEAFDLAVATNVLVYYDVFEQCLAAANVARMLRAGGYLLSNDLVPELEATPLRSVGYRTVVYTARPGDGDHVVFYRRQQPAAP